MGEGATAIAVLIAALFAIRQLYTDPRITPEFRARSWRALGIYAVFLVSGIIVLIALPLDSPDDRITWFAVLAILSWIFLGATWLIRIAPKLRQPPAFLLHPWNWLDWTLITLSIGSALIATYLSLNGSGA